MRDKIPSDIKHEIEKLVKDLNYHSYLYYVLDSPVISDAEYDSLYRHLKELEERHGYILPESPTQRVGAVPLDKFGKVKHAEPMLSLDNAFSHDEVREFDGRVKKLIRSEGDVEYTVEPKYDGLAVELSYRNGLLRHASTRGDGIEGEDVTHNIKTIKAAPLRIEGVDVIPERMDIRGEVYMDIEEFEALNRQREKEGMQLFANPRNAAAGAVRQLDSSITAGRKLHLACYGIGAVTGVEIDSQWDFIKWLEKARFPVPAEVKLVKGIDRVLEAINAIEAKRRSFSFEADGVVIKVNDFALQRQLGVKTREPRWAVAYKFPAHQGTTRVVEIIPSVGRTGVITPIAVLEPVSIGGVTVSRSTLHNWDEIARKDIRIGDTVVVERAGDVIPHVAAVIADKRTGEEKRFHIPDRCPACGSELSREEGEVAVRCIAIDCSAQVQERIRHFASRPAMDIEGFGEKNVELFYSKGLINHFTDLYKLKKEDILSLPRFAEKSAQNLVAAIEKSKHTTFDRFLFALGIMHVGEFSAKVLAGNFEKIEELYHIAPERIMEIKQMGDKTARSVSDFFNNHQNIHALKALKSFGLKITNPDYRGGHKDKSPLEGIGFVITGTLPRPRKEVEDLIEKLGGHVSSAVSKSTGYLVAGESPGSKVQKAKTLGVMTITYDELLELLEQR